MLSNRVRVPSRVKVRSARDLQIYNKTILGLWTKKRSIRGDDKKYVLKSIYACEYGRRIHKHCIYENISYKVYTVILYMSENGNCNKLEIHRINIGIAVYRLGIYYM